MLDSRHDDIKSGRVKLIDGKESFARLREKSAARAQKPTTTSTNSGTSSQKIMPRAPIASRTTFMTRSKVLSRSRTEVTGAPTLPRARRAFFASAIT
jgi:hypothetical protein